MVKKNDVNAVAAEKSVNRWWEFYFVRYFVGTSVGAIVVFILLTSPSLNQALPISLEVFKNAEFGKLSAGYYWTIAFVGLAFCYIASSPILVLHATRGSLLKVRNRLNPYLIWIFCFLVFVMAALQAWALEASLSCSGIACFSNQAFREGLLIYFVVSVIVMGQLFLLWLSLFGKEKDAIEYYDGLVKKRAKADKAGHEYVESYRHLREHGNAFFIVMLEVVLGAFLFYSTLPWIFILMFWIAPSAGVWFFGTILESREFPIID